MASNRLDALVDKTYHALLGIVQTTAVSRRVLQRPPFTFLHKLLLETLEQYGIFTPQQLVFAELVSKEDKAAFLTRAIGFVAYAMANLKEKSISVLLLVSPVKVLAGVLVEDTLEFLQQLCFVCKSPHHEAKEHAARDVVTKGDAQLYTAGVTFRKGLVLIQAIVRAFITRRVGKRRAGGGGGSSSPVASRAMSRTPSAVDFHFAGDTPAMQVGTKFLKEVSTGRVYDGVIVAIDAKRYKVRYDQEPEVEDSVDEIEMRILLEESVRLHGLRERMHASSSHRQSDDELSLMSLPDLSPAIGDASGARPKLTKRHSTSREIERLTSPTIASTTHAALQRSLSTRGSLGALATASPERLMTQEGKGSGSRSSSANRKNRLERVLSELSDQDSRAFREDQLEREDDPVATSRPTAVAAAGQDARADENANASCENKPWQSSLKQLLAKGHAGAEPPDVIKRRNQSQKSKSLLHPQRAKSSDDTSSKDNNNAGSPSPSPSHMPSFPELAIPGTKKLPAVQKRKQPTAGFSTTNATLKLQPKTKALIPGPEAIHNSRQGDRTSSTASLQRGTEISRTSGAAASRQLSSMPMSGNNNNNNHNSGAVDKAFGGAYQSTDQKTQEKLVLFREIVQRIDGYMKRKRLRVIDLFRFCDADGNGSISPQEMIDTLSQMEIQLSPEQGHDFINYIDKDGNGSIDIDEFEELVRVARRNEAQREQLKKELHHAKKTDGSGKSMSNRYAALIKHRHRILDDLRALDLGDVGAVNAAQAKTSILRMLLPGVDDAVVSELFDRARAYHPSHPDGALKSTGSTSSSSPSSSVSSSSMLVAPSTAPLLEQATSTGAEANIHLQHLARALNDLEWSKKPNRFLDPSWLAQFDSQLDRAFRDFELL